MKTSIVLIMGLFICVFTSSAYSVESDKTVGIWLYEKGDLAVDSSGHGHDGHIPANASMASVSFITNMAGTDSMADMISAVDDVRLPDGEILKPRAFNVELGYCLPGIPVELAGRYERLSENVDVATNRYGGIVSLGLFGETTSLAVEFLRTENGDSAENSIISQLAVEF